MDELVKRQHYVWREYLRAWSNNEQIWTYFKPQRKVYISNLMNVAQEKFFYKLVDLTDEDEAYLAKFISNSHWTLKGLQSDFLRAFTAHKQLRKAYDNNKTDEIEKRLKAIETNIMENSHTWIENDGTQLISCKNVEDLLFLEHNDLRHKAIMYLCFQYFRTRKMKDMIEASFNNNPRFARIWNILSFIMATNVSMISLDQNIKYIFFENNTSEKFITTDQPVINTLGDKVDKNGNVLSLEFYYPLSPEHALLIYFTDENIEKYRNVMITEDQVLFYNNKLIEDAASFIFSNNKDQLDRIANNQA